MIVFNAFNPASSPPPSCHPPLPAPLTSSPSSHPLLFTAREQKGLSGLYPPLLSASPPPPCLITSYSTQARTDSSAPSLPVVLLSSHPAASRLCSSHPHSLSSVSPSFSGCCVSLIIQDSLKTPIPRCLPCSNCTYKNNCVCARACMHVHVALCWWWWGTGWSENGGHNGGEENKNSSLCISRASASVFMVPRPPRTLRAALLHCHICCRSSFFFPLPFFARRFQRQQLIDSSKRHSPGCTHKHCCN